MENNKAIKNSVKAARNILDKASLLAFGREVMVEQTRKISVPESRSLARMVLETKGVDGEDTATKNTLEELSCLSGVPLVELYDYPSLVYDFAIYSAICGLAELESKLLSNIVQENVQLKIVKNYFNIEQEIKGRPSDFTTDGIYAGRGTAIEMRNISDFDGFNESFYVPPNEVWIFGEKEKVGNMKCSAVELKPADDPIKRTIGAITIEHVSIKLSDKPNIMRFKFSGD